MVVFSLRFSVSLVVIFYYNDQWQVLEERVGSSTSADKQYIYHPHYVDAIAIRVNSSGKHHYLQDANFNVTSVTDNSGTMVERYSYSPYGEVTVLNNNFTEDVGNQSDIDNDYLYTGRRRDPETGLHLNRNRFYASHLGRWVNRDPIGYIGSPWNLYEYVNSTPVISLDPSGRAAAVIGGGGGALLLEGCGCAGAAAAAPVVAAGTACMAFPVAGYCIGEGAEEEWGIGKAIGNWWCPAIPNVPDLRCEFNLAWCQWGKQKGKKGWKKTADCLACYAECKNTGGIWPLGKCPLGHNGPRWRGDDSSWPDGHHNQGKPPGEWY